jgi:hypothetical protein
MPATLFMDLPQFDTGQYESCEFVMSGGGATLTLHLANLSSFSIRFNKVRWHQFTALPNCTPEMIRDAYFRIAEYKDSLAVANFIQKDSSPIKAYGELRHYRIFFDETGCHEVFAESATAL